MNTPDREQRYLLITTRRAMNEQANRALDEIIAANGGHEPATIRDAYDVDPAAFGSLIEALVALGIPVDAELIALARLRPIDELLQ